MKTIPDQEIFDQVVRHLLTQNERSVKTSSKGSAQCAYRGDNGLMCAVGCLISDENYDPKYEGFGAWTDEVVTSVQASLNGAVSGNGILGALQEVHDNQPVKNWKERLELLSKRLGLEWNHGE